MRSSVMTAMVAALLSALLAGCVASKNPAGPVAEAASEPRLAGTWQYDGPRGQEWDYLHVFLGDEDRTLQVVAINTGERTWAILSGHVTAVGQRRIANLRVEAAGPSLREDLARQGKAESHPYSFVAYRLEGDDRLNIVYPLESLYQAVKSGQLAGETVGEHDAFITDSSDKIAAALGAIPEADLFDDPVIYKRVAGSPP